MSGAFKTLKRSDVQTFPYPANKFWTVNTSSYNSLGIRIFTGQNLPGDFQSFTDPITTDSASGDIEYRRLVYSSMKQLYYSNYLSGSNRNYSSSAENFEQTTIRYSDQTQLYYNSPLKYFPTASNSIIRVLSIPQNIFGSKIVPGTFEITSTNYYIVDDKEGNLFDRSGSNNTLVGNIIYPHGIAVITNPSYSIVFPTASSDAFTLTPGQKTGPFTLNFKGEHIIYENEVRCHISEDEYNYTLNPSISSDGSGSLRYFATGSEFSPYATTVGLYDENNILMAVGKLGQPIFIPRNSDATFIVRWDS